MGNYSGVLQVVNCAFLVITTRLPIVMILEHPRTLEHPCTLEHLRELQNLLLGARELSVHGLYLVLRGHHARRSQRSGST